MMQLSTTRIVSCNMTSFLVLWHERVRYRNGTLKPNKTHWCDHLANENINHLQDASTLCLQKLDDSLAKEAISTHTKCAPWRLAQKADLHSIVKHNCSFFIYYESPFVGILDGWKKIAGLLFQWKVWTTHNDWAFPVSKIHKIHSPKRLRGCVYWGYWSNSKRLPERCLH